MGLTDDEYVKYKAKQEPLMPGVVYAGAAALAGSFLVRRAPSASAKILTPLAFGAVTGAYFLPAHYELLKHNWAPRRASHHGKSSTIEQEAVDTIDDVSRQTQAAWGEIKRDSEKLYEDAGKQVNKVFDDSIDQAPSWLDVQVDEARRLVNDSTSKPTADADTSSYSSFKNKLHNLPQTSESTFYKTTTFEEPSSSKRSWWSSEEKPSTTTTATITTTNEVPPPNQRPRRMSIDKTVAHAAIKQHDVTVNRAALLGKNAEETARKVHDNVIDASKPEPEQSRYEKHPLEVSRKAAESDLKDGKFVVKVTGKEGEIPERVGRAGVKKDFQHGLENLDRRASMLYRGVEHIEHKLNERIQKNLQDEADFWHEQSMKEQSNARGSDKAM